MCLSMSMSTSDRDARLRCEHAYSLPGKSDLASRKPLGMLTAQSGISAHDPSLSLSAVLVNTLEQIKPRY